MKRQFTEEQTQIAKKHKKIYPSSLVVREMQIKVPMSYFSILLSQAKIKKRVKTYCWWGWWKSSLSYYWYKCEVFLKAIRMYLLILKIHIPFNPETPFVLFCPTKIKASVSKDRCSRTFITAFFREEKNTKNRKCSSVAEYVLNYSIIIPWNIILGSQINEKWDLEQLYSTRYK